MAEETTELVRVESEKGRNLFRAMELNHAEVKNKRRKPTDPIMECIPTMFL